MKIKYLVIIIICFFLQLQNDILSCNKAYANTELKDTIHSSINMPAQSASPNLWNFPNYHPLVVHFPIVLLLFAAFLQLLSFWRKDLNLAVLILLAAGTAGAWLASEIFDAHPDTKALSQEAKNIFHVHHQFADYTTWLSTAALVLKSFTFFITKRKLFFEGLVFAVLTASAIAVSVSGHYGSYLVHIEGVGPKGNLLKGE